MGSENTLNDKPDQRFLYATRKAAEAKIRSKTRYTASFSSKAFGDLSKTWSECEAVELTLNLPSEYDGWGHGVDRMSGAYDDEEKLRANEWR